MSVETQQFTGTDQYIAFVVDLMCQVNNFKPKLSATCSASKVLPVPGSPLTNKG